MPTARPTDLKGWTVLATRPGRRVADDSGASAVEFALVVPLLLLLGFGIINFGVLFAQQISLNNAVREGARQAVVRGNLSNVTGAPVTCKGVVDAVRNAAGSTILMNTTKIDVTVGTQSASGVAYSPGPCGTAKNPTTSTVVCLNSAKSGGSDSIVVTATYQSKYPLPWPWVPSSTGVLGTGPLLTSKAVYRCEFTS